MTSIIGIPATYYIEQRDGMWTDECFFLYCDGTFICNYESKEQAEQAARDHYNNSNNNIGE